MLNKIQENKIAVNGLFLLLVGFLSYYFYADRMNLFPSFIHAWTQSDRYAIALSFLTNDFDFAHPATFNLMTIDGITQVDFPINEYIVAIIMKITGNESPLIFRAYTLFYSLVGLYFLYKTVLTFNPNVFFALFIITFVFCSPIINYYQNGFLPSAPALSNLFIGFYFYCKYFENRKFASLGLAFFFFTLAALMRLPFTLFLLSFIVTDLYYTIKLKEDKIAKFAIYFISVALVLAYFLYNRHLAAKYGSMFLSTMMPASNFSDFVSNVVLIKSNWILHFLSGTQWIILAIISAISFVLFWTKYFKLPTGNFRSVLLLWILTFAAIYFVLMNKQFIEHDYYFMDTFYFPLILWLISILDNFNLNHKYSKQILLTFAILSISSLVYSAKIKQDERYTSGTWDRTEETRKNFEGSRAWLDGIGVPKDAKMLVMDSYTTNTPLILMGRKGYTVINTTDKNLKLSLLNDFDYIVIQNKYLVSDVIRNLPELKNNLSKFADNGKISVYKFRPSTDHLSMEEFLGINPGNTMYHSRLNFDTDSLDHYWHNTHRTGKRFLTTPDAAFVDSTMEFGSTFEFKANEVVLNGHDKVLISTSFLLEKANNNVHLVATMSSGDTIYYYDSFAVHDYVKPAGLWREVDFLFVLPTFKTINDVLKVYIWNPGKTTVFYDDIDLIVYKEDYSLIKH